MLVSWLSGIWTVLPYFQTFYRQNNQLIDKITGFSITDCGIFSGYLDYMDDYFVLLCCFVFVTNFHPHSQLINCLCSCRKGQLITSDHGERDESSQAIDTKIEHCKYECEHLLQCAKSIKSYCIWWKLTQSIVIKTYIRYYQSPNRQFFCLFFFDCRQQHSQSSHLLHHLWSRWKMNPLMRSMSSMTLSYPRHPQQMWKMSLILRTWVTRFFFTSIQSSFCKDKMILILEAFYSQRS